MIIPFLPVKRLTCLSSLQFSIPGNRKFTTLEGCSAVSQCTCWGRGVVAMLKIVKQSFKRHLRTMEGMQSKLNKKKKSWEAELFLGEQKVTSKIFPLVYLLIIGGEFWPFDRERSIELSAVLFKNLENASAWNIWSVFFFFSSQNNAKFWAINRMGNKAKSFYKATEMFPQSFSVQWTTLRSRGEEQNRKGAFLKNIGSPVLQFSSGKQNNLGTSSRKSSYHEW